MKRAMQSVSVCIVLFAADAAWGDVVVTLSALDAGGQPITGEVAAGTLVDVDILLSADGEDNPLADLRLMQFDFAATDSNLQLGEFTWLTDPIAYSITFESLPRPSSLTISLAPTAQIISLDETPIRVATVGVTVNGSGTLDAGALAGGQAEFSSGFDTRLDFSSDLGNTSGGTLVFSVTGDGQGDGTGGGGSGGGGGGGGGPDADGDGVPDQADAFPDDPAETLDTDGDGIGNVADTDDDADGVEDALDSFPLDASETADADGDGIGDNGDAFPNDPTETADSDGDGVGDNIDAFPSDPTQTDLDDANSNTGPPAGGGFCGVGMLGAGLWIGIGLTLVSLRRGRRSVL